LLYTIEELKSVGYKGIIVVKSTVLPGYLPKGVVYNPEFLSRATANRDFVRPALLVLGGDTNQIVAKFYHNHTYVVPDKVVVTDVNTAIMIKYLLNTFGATKVTFMNMMHEVAQECGADWNTISNAIADHPYIGRNHTQVPGPDGNFGFGGPCLPKDTKALAEEYDLPLLRTVLELNNHYRSQ
jgi:UDPglucose 6-dehydrogenase